VARRRDHVSLRLGALQGGWPIVNRVTKNPEGAPSRSFLARWETKSRSSAALPPILCAAQSFDDAGAGGPPFRLLLAEGGE